MSCDLLQMGQTDTLLDFGQEECIDFGQENTIGSNDVSELAMVATMSDLEEYKYASYIVPAFPETVSRSSAAERLRCLRCRNKIRFLKDGRLYLYNVRDVIRNVPDIDINKLVTLCPAHKHRSPTTRENLIDGYKSKKPLKCVLNTFNVTTTTLYRTLRRHNVPSYRYRKKLNTDEKQEIIRMYLNGSTQMEISTQLNIAYATVHRHISLSTRQGVIAPIRRARDHIQTILQYYKSGMSAVAISEKLKISKHTVFKYLKKNKVKTNNKPNVRLSKEKVDAIFKLHRENISIRAIAKSLNISSISVYRYLTKKRTYYKS